MTAHLPECLFIDLLSRRTERTRLRVSGFVPNALEARPNAQAEIARMVSGWLADIAERVRRGALAPEAVSAELDRLCREQNMRAEVDRFDDMRQDSGL